MSIANLQRTTARICMRRCWLYFRSGGTIFNYLYHRVGEMRNLVISISPITTSRTAMGLSHMIGGDFALSGVLMQTGNEELGAVGDMAQPPEKHEIVCLMKPEGLEYGFKSVVDFPGADLIGQPYLDPILAQGLAKVIEGVSVQTGGDIDLGGGESGIEITITKALSLDEYAALISDQNF